MLPALTSSPRAALASLRAAAARARLSSPRTFALVLACGLLVAVGPVALTLARAKGGYTASSTIAQTAPRPELTPAKDVASSLFVMGSILNSPDLQGDVVGRLSWLGSRKEVGRRVTLSGRLRGGRPEIVVAARGQTAGDARQLAAVTASGLSTRIEPVARVGGTYRSVLRSQGRVFRAPTPGPADAERLGDRVLAAVPGRVPPRPQPGWAAAVGLALGAALVVAALRLGRWDREPGRDAAA